MTLADLEELAAELWDPARLSVAGIGPDEQRFEEALAEARTRCRLHDPGRGQRRRRAHGVDHLRRRRGRR